MIDPKAFREWSEAHALVLRKRKELQELTARAAREDVPAHEIVQAQVDLGKVRDRADELFRRAFPDSAAAR